METETGTGTPAGSGEANKKNHKKKKKKKKEGSIVGGRVRIDLKSIGWTKTRFMHFLGEFLAQSVPQNQELALGTDTGQKKKSSGTRQKTPALPSVETTVLDPT